MSVITTQPSCSAPGRLALFWNSYVYGAEVQTLIDAVLARRAPALLLDAVPFGSATIDLAALDAEMESRSSLWFGPSETRVFPHGRRMKLEDWLAELQTHSPVSRLEDGARAALLADLASSLAVVAAEGMQVSYETRITTVVRVRP